MGTSRLAQRSINWSPEDSTPTIDPMVEVTKTPARVLPSNIVPLIIVAPTIQEHNLDKQTGDVQTDPTGKPCVSLFAGNRVASNGMALNYITPEMVNGNIIVKLDEKELEKEEEK
ncbi:hypothetical protein KY290_007576 [Solanum tuberosum]|uniref:Uncharacterized protein n=1 Tax=Solanum tuberosum TaxID=4113 RepID=A0ABQ7W6G2_SOLTU|nr:hypothetical protein KY290_007576 [Solanum tuberosum]